MKGSLDGRVIQCAAQHCKILHVQDLAVHKAFSGSCNSLRGTKYSLRGTNIVFRDTTVNTLRGTKWTADVYDGELNLKTFADHSRFLGNQSNSTECLYLLRWSALELFAFLSWSFTFFCFFFSFSVVVLVILQTEIHFLIRFLLDGDKKATSYKPFLRLTILLSVGGYRMRTVSPIS